VAELYAQVARAWRWSMVEAGGAMGEGAMAVVAVDAVPASRALDVLIAQRVLGAEPPEGYTFDGEQWVKHVIEHPDPDGARVWYEWNVYWPPHYSDDVSVAMETVAEMQQRGDAEYFSLDWVDGEGDCWECWIGNGVESSDFFSAGADTAPLAICRVLLKASGIEEVDL
jgi:hypothetical protein